MMKLLLKSKSGGDFLGGLRTAPAAALFVIACFACAYPSQAMAGADGVAYQKKYLRPASIPYPKDNVFSPQREKLGRMLFFDPRLSGSNWISCGTCHNPALAWGDGLPKGIGHGMKQLGRRTPTILNLAWAEAFFWDGRASTLEEQALGPIAAPGEMNLPTHKMIDKIAGIPGYKLLFHKAYPGASVDEKLVAKAIATFERNVVSAKAPFDRWLEGDRGAISEDAKRGFALFNGKANCAKCHGGWRFTDDGFHDIGVPGEDRGRGALFKEIPEMQFAFKTPTLRDVARRAPYMHDGSEKSLEDVIEFYNGAGKAKRPSLSPEIKTLELSAGEKRDLVALLKALTGADKATEVPSLPR